MKILPVEQKSPEWYQARRGIFTASETGDFVAEPKKFRLTIAEAREILPADALPPAKATAAEHQAAVVALYGDKFHDWTETTKKARQNLIAKKLAEPFYSDPKMAPLAGSALLVELRDRAESRLDRDPAIMRGNLLEPLAREAYEARTGYSVSTVGMCIHNSGGFGCSPDGLIAPKFPAVAEGAEEWERGTEIKCPIPETHAKYLLAGTLPDEYRPQVHHSLAVTGLQRWDFFSFCPGLPSLLVTVERDDYTERFLEGLLSLSAELEATRAKLSAMWQAEFGKGAA